MQDGCPRHARPGGAIGLKDKQPGLRHLADLPVNPVALGFRIGQDRHIGPLLWGWAHGQGRDPSGGIGKRDRRKIVTVPRTSFGGGCGTGPGNKADRLICYAVDPSAID